MLTIAADSHLDHGLRAEHLRWLLERFRDREAFFVETVELPAELPPLSSALYGPTMSDAPVLDTEVVLEARGGRSWPSRLVDRPQRPTRLLTVVAGPHEGLACVLYTSYGGPAAPREPGDPALAAASVEAQESSRAF